MLCASLGHFQALMLASEMARATSPNAPSAHALLGNGFYSPKRGTSTTSPGRPPESGAVKAQARAMAIQMEKLGAESSKHKKVQPVREGRRGEKGREKKEEEKKKGTFGSRG